MYQYFPVSETREKGASLAKTQTFLTSSLACFVPANEGSARFSKPGMLRNRALIIRPNVADAWHCRAMQFIRPLSSKRESLGFGVSP